MLQFLKKESNHTLTENGALTHASTQSECLDLFSTAGALRHADETEIRSRFTRAFAENPLLTTKIIFYARDVRGGLGERRVFRVLVQCLAQTAPQVCEKNLELVAEYGRYDDLLVLLDTPCHQAVLALIKKRLREDLEALKTEGAGVSLLAKWLPSINTSSAETVRLAKRIARSLGMTDAQYRKILSRLRARIALLENSLRLRDYSFSYSAQPSKAMHKYRKAFLRNDQERYLQFLEEVRAGRQTMHTSTLFPYDLVSACFTKAASTEERLSLDTAWRALPDCALTENALVVVDGSGSMYWNVTPSPITVAISLGLYFAERSQGAFANHFITFSEHPRLVEIKGNDLWEKVRYCASYNECANTNLSAVFELILRTAVKHRLAQKDLPATLYIVSDMEFDRCANNADLTNFQAAKKCFAQRGYLLPKVVFWNVASRTLQQPVTQNEQGVALVSGCSPLLFELVQNRRLSPFQLMLDILGAERYAAVSA